MATIMCALGGPRCSSQVEDAGGFDQHHEWPQFLGGAPGQTTMLTLCPNHHRRQHSLIRHLVEAHLARRRPDVAVVRRFARAERQAADVALRGWVSIGAPVPDRWGVEAATASE